MKIIFNDATELEVQKVTESDGYITVLALASTITPEQLREMLTDEDKTKIMTVKDKNRTVDVYEGFTVFYRTEAYTGGILGVVNYKPDKTPEYEADVIESSVKVAKIQAQSLDDEQALTVQNLYPEWHTVIGRTVSEGFKFNYLSKLYKTIQPELTIQEQYVPGEETESLYAVIDEIHEGSESDPIPYNGNMELFAGKYYIQANVLYKCVRDTEQPVYHELKNLVGIYVEVV